MVKLKLGFKYRIEKESVMYAISNFLVNIGFSSIAVETYWKPCMCLNSSRPSSRLFRGQNQGSKY